ncbi:MAG: transposase [Acidimicrobiales bacterium]
MERGDDAGGRVVERHGFVESRMRWKSHVRFGGRAEETELSRDRHRASVRSHLANRAIDQVRRRVQNQTLQHRGHSGDPLYEIRRLLLRGIERHSERSRARLEAGLAAGDPTDEVLDALLAKESLRSMYGADTLAEAERLLDAFVAECNGSSAPELHRLARTIFRWRIEILAHHSTDASNGPTEAVNLVVKKVVRVAHGFRSFRNFRLRVLLHCGVEWHTPPAARIRGRSPGLVA